MREHQDDLPRRRDVCLFAVAHIQHRLEEQQLAVGRMSSLRLRLTHIQGEPANDA